MSLSLHFQENIPIVFLDDACNVYFSFTPTKIYHSNYGVMTAVHFKVELELLFTKMCGSYYL